MSLLTHAQHGIKQLIHEDVKFRPAKAFGIGLRDGLKGNALNVPFIAMEVASAQRGEQMATLTGRVGGILTYPVFAGVLAAGIAMIPGVNVAAGLIGAMIAMYPNGLLEDSVIRKVKWLNTTGKNIRHLEVGGAYQDTNLAAHQRQIAMMELSSAIQPARRFLGQEGLAFHK
jgi:hypothetical protein